jgi:hypothetical protein
MPVLSNRRLQLARRLVSLNAGAWSGLPQQLAAYWRNIKRDRALNADQAAFRHYPAPIFREAFARAGGHPRILFACFNDFLQEIKYDLMFAAALADQGARPMVLTRRGCGAVRRYWSDCGLEDQIYYLEDWETKNPGPSDDLECLLGNGAEPEISKLLSLHYRDVAVGRWALADSFASLRRSASELNDPHACQVLRSALLDSYQTTDAVYRALEAVRPDKIIFLEKGYTPAGQLYEAALGRGIDIIQYVHAHASDVLMIKRYHPGNRYAHMSQPSEKTWHQALRASDDPDLPRKVQTQILQSYARGEWFNRKYGQVGKRYLSPEELAATLKLDGSRRTAVIFTHVGWDATFFYGENLFADYDEWLVETARAASRLDNVNWVVKVHPDNLWKSHASRSLDGVDRDRRLIERSLGGIPSNIRWIGPETHIRTDAMFGVTDFCLTVRGTIGLEMACMGKHVLTAGTGRYSGYGFTLDSSSVSEYMTLLTRLHELPPPSAEQTAQAALYVNSVIWLRPLKMLSSKDVRLALDRLGKDALGDNLIFTFADMVDFSKASDLAAFTNWLSNTMDEDLIANPCVA